MESNLYIFLDKSQFRHLNQNMTCETFDLHKSFFQFRVKQYCHIQRWNALKLLQWKNYSKMHIFNWVHQIDIHTTHFRVVWWCKFYDKNITADANLHTGMYDGSATKCFWLLHEIVK